MLLFLLLSLIATLVSSDTPANCSFEDIRGKWIFSETEATADKSEDCTSLGPVVREIVLDLQYPNVASDCQGNEGHWTLIYNQGFEVTINQRKYFAFSYYVQEEDNVTSYCGRTFNGWSHDILVRNWACYNATKVDPVPPKSYIVPPFELASIKFHNDLGLINAINSAQESWIARPYPQFEGKSYEDMIRMSGGRKSRILGRPSAIPATAEIKKAANLLPREFDWRNVDGQNFVSPVGDQEFCGSCYAFSALGQIESRLKILTNNTVDITLSVQDVIECCEYSQGCDGGFPYLIAGKYAQDFGVVTEDCNSYTSFSESCQTPANCSRHYVSAYQYVGGYYGGCNEESMRLSLVQGGPVSVGFEVYGDFYSYAGGVYHHVESTGSNFDPFLLTNHAVLVVGYGVDSETGEKFWSVKNSWGKGWGEDGYFRIRRGTDECAIESIASEVIPIPY